MESQARDRIPLRRDLRYLDVGCGQGDLTIAFAMSGCDDICGIDMVPRNIARAKLYAEQLKLDDKVHFVCENFHEWKPPAKFDVVLSHEALENILEPKASRATASARWSPTTESWCWRSAPYFIPRSATIWVHTFGCLSRGWESCFPEQAILRLRTENFRPGDDANRYQDIRGCLNLMRYSEFRRYLRETGWHLDTLIVNPQLKRYPPLYRLSCVLTRLPIIQDYFASSIYAILRR